MKKGESISMSVIIIAAIALLVLVVLAVLILRTGKGIGDGTGCTGVGGNCKEAGGCSDFESRDFAKSGSLGGCTTDRPDCCVPVTRDPEAQ